MKQFKEGDSVEVIDASGAHHAKLGDQVVVIKVKLHIPYKYSLIWVRNIEGKEYDMHPQRFKLSEPLCEYLTKQTNTEGEVVHTCTTSKSSCMDTDCPLGNEHQRATHQQAGIIYV